MTFTLYQTWPELPQNSDLLFSNAEKESVFYSREWFEAITPHLSNQYQALLLACVIDNDRVLAILPLLTNNNREWTSFTHPYSSLFSLLLADKQKPEVLECLCLGLKTLEFDYLSLEPVSTEGHKLQQFQNAMEAIGFSCYRNHKAYNWFHRIEDNLDFSDYIAQRSSKIRNTIMRKQRKLAGEHAYEIQLFINEGINSALKTYHELYKHSWKANEQHQELVEDVVKQFANRTWPRLAILTVADKPIAAQLWFVVEGKASIFRLVYDEAWKAYSPGSILTSFLLEHVIDNDKVKELDFLSGNDAYKKDWMSERRERQALVFVKNKNEETKQASKNMFKKLILFISK